VPLGNLLRNIRRFSKYPYNFENIENWPYWMYQEEIIIHNEEVELKNAKNSNMGEVISNVSMNRKMLGY
jgi:hypothetical protein